jgi:RNA polymerase subunit RPABC4/transcription elongation factor Spt4
MPQVLVQCKNCQRIFPSGIELGPGATAILRGNVSQCPFCGSMENIPDGTFRGTVEDVVKILENTPDRLKTAKDLLEALEKNKSKNDLSEVKHSSKFSKFKKWLPDSPQKIAVYIAILQVIIQMLTKNPSIRIEYNNFVNVYNKVTINQAK